MYFVLKTHNSTSTRYVILIILSKVWCNLSKFLPNILKCFYFSLVVCILKLIFLALLFIFIYDKECNASIAELAFHIWSYIYIHMSGYSSQIASILFVIMVIKSRWHIAMSRPFKENSAKNEWSWFVMV